MIGALVLVTGFIFALRYKWIEVPLFVEVGLYLLAMLVGCLVCHGELYRCRPRARRLTSFYLCISRGGALGGVLVAIVAPLVLSDYLEMFLALPAGVLLATWMRGRRMPVALRASLTALSLAAMGWVFAAPANVSKDHDLLIRDRNFYGVLSVEEKLTTSPSLLRVRVLRHGTTVHGAQMITPVELRQHPVGYYGEHSGIGATMRILEDRRRRQLGVIGLGAGIIATYCRPDDTIRFYEINPQVQRLAQEQFYFLSECLASVDVILGDGRLSVAREELGGFDVLVLDAFSSDAIPVHLLTREAFAIYLDRLAPDGILALHLTNRFLELAPIVIRLAEDAGWPSYWLRSRPGRLHSTEHPTSWVLVTRRPDVLDDPFARSALSPVDEGLAGLSVWTDDHVNLLEAYR
jgi:hypothetical protein